jgi:Domain of unknown function (DUF1996)
MSKYFAALAAFGLALGVAATIPSTALASGTFGSIQVVCRPAHSQSDDPIMMPGMPGASHRHEFFANRSTNASSTNASLAGKPTTCSRRGDTAAYWTPTLFNNGKRVVPDRVVAYYRTRGIRDIGSIRPFPPGLKMIAGNDEATAAHPQATGIVNWACGDGIQGTAKPPASCSSAALRLRVAFPNCWDGKQLDSADHKSHMAYAQQGGCPASHPVPVPTLELNFRWKISGSLSNLRLSSGDVYTGHADFWNSWHQDVLTQLVHDCLNAGQVCNSGIGDAPNP